MGTSQKVTGWSLKAMFEDSRKEAGKACHIAMARRGIIKKLARMQTSSRKQSR